VGDHSVPSDGKTEPSCLNKRQTGDPLRWQTFRGLRRKTAPWPQFTVVLYQTISQNTRLSWGGLKKIFSGFPGEIGRFKQIFPGNPPDHGLFFVKVPVFPVFSVVFL
jgi:hypothetical protein